MIPFNEADFGRLEGLSGHRVVAIIAGGNHVQDHLRVKFRADPAIVYDLPADSRKHTAITGWQAVISRKIGGAFSIGESDVTGINVDLPGDASVRPGVTADSPWASSRWPRSHRRQRPVVARNSCRYIAAFRRT